jgi:hypothetical protein
MTTVGAMAALRAFHERLGFVVIEATTERSFMEWMP